MRCGWQARWMGWVVAEMPTDEAGVEQSKGLCRRRNCLQRSPLLFGWLARR